MKTNYLLIISLGMFCLISCKKDHEQSGVNFDVNTTGRTTTVGRLAGITGTITWTSGYASANEIEFEAENENTEVAYKSTVNQRIDLFSSLSSLGFVTIPPGTYEEVEFEIHLASTPTNSALEIRGLFNTTPIIFKINTPIEIEAEFEDVVITQSNSSTALITLNLGLLTQGITDARFSSAALTNGEIIISSNSNVALYNSMIENLSEIDDVELDD